MLQNKDVIAFVPTQNADQSKAFYQDTLGLKFISDDGFALVFNAHDAIVRIARSAEFARQPFTILGWQMNNIAEVAKKLRDKGAVFEKYGLLTQHARGIWDAPDGAAKVAWFKDPGSKTLVATYFRSQSTSND